MHNIVVPLDGSTVAERALRVAYGAAERAGGCVTAIRVRVPDDRDDPDAYLASAVERFVDSAPTTTLSVAGSPVDRILEAGGEAETVICMSTHGRTGISRLVLGSVADDIVHRSVNPVIVVGPQGAATPLRSERGHIIVCTDGSASSSAAFPVAAGFARDLDLTCSVVNVAPPDEDVSLDLEPAPQPIREQAHRFCERCCEELAAHGTPASWQVLSGDPARAIAHHASVNHVSLIAVATHGYSGLTRVTLGSTAGAVVRHAPCPVLITRTTEDRLRAFDTPPEPDDG